MPQKENTPTTPAFSGKVAVVMGGAYGIGKALADALRAQGAAVKSIGSAPVG